MKRGILYGIGSYYKEHRHLLPEDMEVIAYGDSSEEKSTSRTGKMRDGKPILTPAEIEKEEFDVLYICTDIVTCNIIYQYLRKFDIPVEKIRFLSRINTVRGGWEYAIQEDKSIISTIGNVKIREKERTDFNIVAEVFAFNGYDVDIGEKGTIVIDMGMNIGAATLFFAANEKVDKVYGYEPFEDTYAQALANFSLNQEEIRSKIRPFCLAVSDWEGEEDIPVNAEESGWRSILSKDERKRKVKIHCRKAGDVVGEIIKENPERRIVLKVDTEGSEFPIFESLEKAGLLKEIDTIAMEYHDDPAPILDMLKKNQFRYVLNGRLTVGMIYAFRL